MRLYSYFRSSASYRVRIALQMKGIDYEYVPVHLVKNGGEQHSEWFADINPQQLVPVLEHDGFRVTQSLAIIEYLDETCGGPKLLPNDPQARARIRALAQSIACEIHPLNNLAVLRYLANTVGAFEVTKDAWYRHWVASGFSALEKRLSRDPQTGGFCHGDEPTLADCCLVPQLYNARRFECDLSPYPTLVEIDARCRRLKAFDAAAPERQPDAV